MKRFISFGEIQQFRNIIKNVQRTAQYFGQDENDEPIVDRNAPMPVVRATASEKVHGTNASVCYSKPDGFWVQSRKKIITPEHDNAGCAFVNTVYSHQWIYIISELADAYNIDLNKNIITIYFEWAGDGIQKNSAWSGFTKAAFIFQHFKVSPIERQPADKFNDDEISTWHETKVGDMWIGDGFLGKHNIMNYKTWEITIDFSNPLLSQNEMIKIVAEEIEPNSPLAVQEGKEGNIGEGMVVTFMYKGSLQRFKVKSEKHSATKVKTLKPVDEEKEKAKIEFANYACSSSRLEQAWQTVFGIVNEKQDPDIKFTGDFLRAVITDVMKEEMDIMIEKGIEPKTVNGKISKVARRWFMDQLDKR